MSESKRGNVSLRPSELVIAAIHNLEEKRGSSSNDIVNFISNKYELDSKEVKSHVEKALKRGVCFGVLSENEGFYRLLDVNAPKLPSGGGQQKRRALAKKTPRPPRGRGKQANSSKARRGRKFKMSLSGRQNQMKAHRGGKTQRNDRCAQRKPVRGRRKIAP